MKRHGGEIHSSQPLLDELLKPADARGLLLRCGSTEGQAGPAVGPRGGGGQPLPEEVQHVALLTALQTLDGTVTHKEINPTLTYQQ